MLDFKNIEVVHVSVEKSKKFLAQNQVVSNYYNLFLLENPEICEDKNNYQILSYIASDYTTPIYVLQEMANSKDPLFLKIAKNPSSNHEILIEFVERGYFKEVFDNPNVLFKIQQSDYSLANLILEKIRKNEDISLFISKNAIFYDLDTLNKLGIEAIENIFQNSYFPIDLRNKIIENKNRYVNLYNLGLEKFVFQIHDLKCLLGLETDESGLFKQVNMNELIYLVNNFAFKIKKELFLPLIESFNTTDIDIFESMLSRYCDTSVIDIIIAKFCVDSKQVEFKKLAKLFFKNASFHIHHFKIIFPFIELDIDYYTNKICDEYAEILNCSYLKYELRKALEHQDEDFARYICDQKISIRDLKKAHMMISE
jgi:hypothetical protein